jgi:hypothetical protein
VPDQETYEQFWEEAVVQLLHPTQLLIIEALIHLDRPVSASIMVRISGGQIKLASWDYHCRRLATLGLLEPIGSELRRGATENFFALRLNGQRR